MGVSLVYLGRNDDDREMDGMYRPSLRSCKMDILRFKRPIQVSRTFQILPP